MRRMKPTKEYWWVSVGGNACEPAVVAGDQVFTFGCPDAFKRGDVELVKEMDAAPDTPKQAARKAAAWERKMARDAKRGIIHGYRQF